MRIVLPYAHVEEVLGEAFQGQLPPETIRSRVRYLQRLKFPPGMSTGKGRRARYGAIEIVLFAIAISLNLGGKTAEESAAITIQSEELIASAIGRVLASDRSDPIYLVLDAEGAGALAAQTLKELAKSPQAAARINLINLSELLLRMDRWFISSALDRAQPQFGRWVRRSLDFLQDLRVWSGGETSDVD